MGTRSANGSGGAVELAWNYGEGFGVFGGREGSLEGALSLSKPIALQGVSVERVTGIEPALSAWH